MIEILVASVKVLQAMEWRDIDSSASPKRARFRGSRVHIRLEMTIIETGCTLSTNVRQRAEASSS